MHAARWVYNWSLATKKSSYERDKSKLFKFDLQKQLVLLMREPEYVWLKDYVQEIIRYSIDNMDSAFKNFFKGNGYPKFKSRRHSKMCFTTHQNKHFSKKFIGMRIFGEDIRARCSKKNWEDIKNLNRKSITYSKDSLGHYYASVLVEDLNEYHLGKLDKTIGIDLGISNFAVTSDGEFIENPKFFRKSEKKLARAQRILSRRKKGSKRKDKSKKVVAKLHKKVLRKRQYFIHNVSNKLINENQVIVLETLRIKNMVKNHNLAKSIMDSGWGEFVRQLEYKAIWRGRDIVKADWHFPSSKTCSNCGNKKDSLSLKERKYVCNCCGYTQDRDLNAAINLKNLVGGRTSEPILVEKPKSTLVETTKVVNETRNFETFSYI